MAPQGVVLVCCLLLLAPGNHPALPLQTDSPPSSSSPQSLESSSPSSTQRPFSPPGVSCFCLPRWPTPGRGQQGWGAPSAGGQRFPAPLSQPFFPLVSNANSPFAPPATLPKRIDPITGNGMTSHRPGREPWRVTIGTPCRISFAQQFPYMVRYSTC